MLTAYAGEQFGKLQNCRDLHLSLFVSKDVVKAMEMRASFSLLKVGEDNPAQTLYLEVTWPHGTSSLVFKFSVFVS